MEKLGEALVKLVEAGAPLASTAIHWWFVIRLIEDVLAYGVAFFAFGIVAYVARNAVSRWKDYVEARKEYWIKNRY